MSHLGKPTFNTPNVAEVAVLVRDTDENPKVLDEAVEEVDRKAREEQEEWRKQQ